MHSTTKLYLQLCFYLLRQCGGLNEYGPHRLLYLNTYLVLGQWNCLGRIRDYGLIRGGVSWGLTLRFQKLRLEACVTKHSSHLGFVNFPDEKTKAQPSDPTT